MSAHLRLAALIVLATACTPPNFKGDSEPSDTSTRQTKNADDGDDNGKDDDDDDKDDAETSDDELTSKRTTPAPSSSGPEIEEAPPTAKARRIGGSLATTPTVAFGGDGHCDFRETLSDVVVSVSVDASGLPTGALVTAKSTEEIVSNPCRNTPIAPHTQKWRMTSTRKKSGGVQQIELLPDPTNKPPSSLVVEGDFGKAPTTVSLTWHRTDYGAPLDWTVKATAPLSELP